MEDNFKRQKDQLEDYAQRFARIDFDDVSDLNRRAYILFSAGILDSVTIVLEEADLMARTIFYPENQDCTKVLKWFTSFEEILYILPIIVATGISSFQKLNS